MAEGIMRQKIRMKGLDWTVASAGVQSYHVGEPPHKYSQKVCARNGVDISMQRASKFSAADMEAYDKVYAMADDVYNEIRRIAGTGADAAKLELFLNELEPGSNASVPDPWYGPEMGYHAVYDMINRTCDAIIEKYK
jgi:protein-tyrosine phosphatase